MNYKKTKDTVNKKDSSDIDTCISDSDSDSDISSVSYSSISSSDILKIKENSKIKLLIEENINFENFHWKTYVNNYDDLKKITTKREAWTHWINHGMSEGRSDKKEKNVNSNVENVEYENFNWKTYIKKYNDLKSILSKEQAWLHWINHGKHEGRTIDDITNSNDYISFDWKTYVNNYNDLKNIDSKEVAWCHWINNGKQEGRSLVNLKNNEYEKFLWETYIDNYSDLYLIDNKEEAWKHWIYHGKKEGRTCYLIQDNENNNVKENIQKKHETIDYIKDQEQMSEGNIYSETNISINLENIKSSSSVQSSSSELSSSIVSSNSSKTINDNSTVNINSNRVIFKSSYDNYGCHFFGWKGSINYFIDNFENKHNYKYNLFFDEWVEKLLLWGSKKECKKYIDIIKKNNLKLITFIHNPPLEMWNDNKQQKKIANYTLVNDNYQFNENLFIKMEKEKISKNLIYFYTLSNFHKEYLYNKYPEHRKSLMSIYHPICLDHSEEETFDYNLFLKSKNIYHIGWWLRDFNSFNKFKPPPDYKKVLLLKKDFKKIWEEKFKLSLDKDIKIVEELPDEKYTKIFKNSCIYLDIVDGVANNLVLECIKYNTPLIVKRIPSLEEYLGVDYPLFFNKQKDINEWMSNENTFLELFLTANKYLKNLNKKYISLDLFGKKINYDISKLEKNINNSYVLTCFCIHDDLKLDINVFLEKMVEQTIYMKLKIIIIISQNEIFDADYSNYEYKNINVEFIKSIKENRKTTLNNCIKKVDTEFIMFTKITDLYKNNSFELMVNYLDNNPNCDLVTSSYNVNSNNNIQTYTYEKDGMLFKKNICNEIYLRMVWRKKIHEIFNIDLDEKFVENCIYNNLNIISASCDPLYTICA
jgi:hypothetical protein